MKFLLFLVIILSPLTKAWSNQATFFSGQRSKTSDNIRVNFFQLNFESELSDINWPYSDQNLSQPSYGLEVQQQEITGPRLSFNNTLVAPQFTHNVGVDLRLSYQLGYYHLNVFNNNDLNQLRAKFDLKKNFRNQLFLDVTADRGFLFQSTIPLGGTADSFYGTQFDGRLLYRFLEKLDLSLRSRAQFFSDQNQSSKNDLQLMYAFLRHPHWLLFGLGSETLSFQSRSTSYWSPRFFRSWGPRMDVNYSLSEKFSAFLGGSYNFFKEDDFSSGSGFFGRTGLQWGNRNQSTIVAFYERNESTQNGRIWFNDSFGLNWNKIW